jgi:hypothetical protein
MRHGYRVVGIIDHPTPEQKAACDARQLGDAYEAPSGRIVATLHRDAVATAILTPDRWKIEGSEQLPRLRLVGDGPVPPSAYLIPELLATHTRFSLQHDEFGHTGGFAYVVAGWHGESIHPYVTYRRRFQGDWHTAAGFSGEALSRVGWLKQQDGKSGFTYVLEIDRARIGVSVDTVVVHPEVLLANLLVPAPPSTPRLRASLAARQLAVDALYRRLTCEGCASAHFAA